MKKLLFLILFSINFSYAVNPVLVDTDVSIYSECSCEAWGSDDIFTHSTSGSTNWNNIGNYTQAKYICVNNSARYIFIDAWVVGTEMVRSYTINTCYESCADNEVRVDGECVAPPTQECGEGQEMFEDVCYDKCGYNGLTVEGVCVERDNTECHAGYTDWYSIGVGDASPTCNDADNDNFSNSYPLRPNEEEGYAALTCCGLPSSSSDDAVVDAVDDSATAVTDAQRDTTQALEDLASDLSSSSSLTNSVLQSIDSTLDVFTEEERERYLQTRADQALINQALSDQYSQDRQNTLDVLNSLSTINSSINQPTYGDKYDDIIIGLRDVVNSNNAMGEQANVNAQIAHDDATDIKDAVEDLETLSDSEQSEVDGLGDSYNNLISDSEAKITGMVNNFNAISNAWITTPPVFTSDGECSINYTIFGRNATLSICWIANLRDYFDIFFALLLAFLNFKMYTKITMFIIKIGV